MRVTNEVLNQWIDTRLVMHRNGDVEPISENRSMKSAQDMAYDLLEARDLIKEVREILNKTVSLDIGEGGCYYNNRLRYFAIGKVLEKSKDYA